MSPSTKSSGDDPEPTTTDADADAETDPNAELPETDFEKAQRAEIEEAGAEY